MIKFGDFKPINLMELLNIALSDAASIGDESSKKDKEVYHFDD